MTGRAARPAVDAHPGAWRAPVFVFGVALALRLAHVRVLRDSPYFQRPLLDADTYYEAAWALATGAGWQEAVYWRCGRRRVRTGSAGPCAPRRAA